MSRNRFNNILDSIERVPDIYEHRVKFPPFSLVLVIMISIGVHWHQFSDQATSARFCGENFQTGFTDVCDTPYEETVNASRNIGYRMYEYRNSAR